MSDIIIEDIDGNFVELHDKVENACLELGACLESDSDSIGPPDTIHISQFFCVCLLSSIFYR